VDPGTQPTGTPSTSTQATGTPPTSPQRFLGGKFFFFLLFLADFAIFS
jgi:hypothetical protein